MWRRFGLPHATMGVVVCVVSAAPSAAHAQQSPAARLVQVLPGELQHLTVVVPAEGRPRGSARYRIVPVGDVTIAGPRTGTLSWSRATGVDPTIKLPVIVPRKQSPGSVVVARAVTSWPDGSETTTDVRVEVLPLPPGASSRDIEAELVPTPRAVSPGGIVKLLYTVSSYEDTDDYVRVRLEAGPGWTVVSSEADEPVQRLEAWDELEGELYLQAPADAAIGDRQLVRLVVEIAGDSGVVDAQNYVAIARTGGLRPGQSSISAAATAGASRVTGSNFEGAQRALGLTLSSRLTRQQTFSLTYDRGVQENLTNFRFEELRTRFSTSLRGAGWDITGGNFVSSAGNALNGPSVRGRGVGARRLTGRWVGDVLVAQPDFVGGTAAGHVVRGRLGIRNDVTTIAFSASDFGRPTGGYSTLPAVQQSLVNADEQERIDIERRLTESAASNGVRGAGVDAEVRMTPRHTVSLRTGRLWLENASGTRVEAPSSEASYVYAGKPALLNVRWRAMPPTVRGVSLPGDEQSADGWLRIGGSLRAVGRAYRTSSATFDEDTLDSSGQGLSGGLAYVQGRRRIEVRGNHRETSFGSISRRRTVSMLFTTPVGPLTVAANADVGEQTSGSPTATSGLQHSPVGFYRADVRWTRQARTVSFSVTHSEASGYRRDRADILVSVGFGGWELAGGAWGTRGYTLCGGQPGAWTTIGMPIGGDRLLTLGADYSALTWTGEPALRGLITVRQRFSLPTPFSRPRPARASSTPVTESHPLSR